MKSLVWGGNKIAGFKGLEQAGDHIGESWELSGVKGDVSVVSEGPFEGRLVTELAEEYKGKLLGERVYKEYGTTFPLLIKVIDAAQPLSVQVHPNDEQAARQHNGSKGKTEMWYVVSSEPGTKLYCGLNRPVTPEEYEQRVENQTLTEVLREYTVEAGDVFFLPAGRIHSIGAGCFIVEVQQTSDITYRIYDFGRVGLDGKPRELHTELAKKAIVYETMPEEKKRYEKKPDCENVLVECPYFVTSYYETDKPVEKDMSAQDSFTILIVVEGFGLLTDDQGHTVSVKRGETVLIPAETKKFKLVPDGKITFLSVRAGE